MGSFLDSITTGLTPKPRRTMIYGVPAVGKSSFAAMADSPIFIQTEEGLGDIDCAKFPLAKSYEEVLGALEGLYSMSHEYKTVVIDSLDWLERLIHSHVCLKKNVASIEDIGYGKGYLFALTYWKEILDGLSALRDDKNMGVLLIAHSQIVRFEAPDQEAYDRYSPRLNKAANAMIQEWCDEVLFANYQIVTKVADDGKRKRTVPVGKGERVLHTTERPAFVAKNRLNMPEEIELDYSVYSSFFKKGK